MPTEQKKVDLVLQCALLLAGQEDDFADRQLGPIHLIKYVYIADLAYARRNEGETYTGTDWRFFKFGPWAQSVNERISPALLAIHAERNVFESDYEDREDWVRWRKHDEYLLVTIERELPPYVVRDLRRDVHKFKKDTPSLLDYVYKTNPMLSAAPNEKLDFSLVVIEQSDRQDEQPASRFEQLSNKKQKKFGEKMRELKDARKARGPRTMQLVKPPAPRYDDVFEQGISWLESLAGPELEEKEITVEFSEDVWKSETRKDKDVS